MSVVAAAPVVPMPSPTYESEEFVSSEGTYFSSWLGVNDSELVI
jgi:hypothetical protein